MVCRNISVKNTSISDMPKAFVNESDVKYQRLFKLYKQAYPDKRGDAVTDEVVKIWRDTLEKGKNEEKYRFFLARLERRVDKVSGNNIRACFVKQRSVEKMEVEVREEEQEMKEDEVEKGIL